MLKNLVEETANNPGTGATVTLGGAPAGRLTWRGSGFSNGATVFYIITDGTVSEWGVGTLTLSVSDTLSRDTVLGNSSGTTTRLNFTGTVRVYNALPAERALYIGQASLAIDGNIAMTKTSPQIALNKTASGQTAAIYGQKTGSNRWSVEFGDTNAETTTGNAGSNFVVSRYSDAGALLDSPMSISRSTGLVTLGNGGLSISGGSFTIAGPINGASASITGTMNAGTVQQAGNALLPPGVMLPYGGSSTPAGYLPCDGAAVSRTTYAGLFTAIGTAWGAGNGTTTFNVPDMRGRVAAGADGGTSRLTGYTLGTVGGVSSVTLSSTEIPAHSHTVNDSGHVHAVSDPGHSHGYNDPGHSHGLTGSLIASGGAGVGGSGTGQPGGTINSSFVGITIAGATTGISIVGSGTGITLQNTGGGAAHTNIQPTAAVNYIIKT